MAIYLKSQNTGGYLANNENGALICIDEKSDGWQFNTLAEALTFALENKLIFLQAEIDE
jgi:hypothetical protein